MKTNMDGYCIHCTAYGSLERHHLVPRAHGGGDEAENMIFLCKPCHRRAHAGYGKVQRRVRAAEAISSLIGARRASALSGLDMCIIRHLSRAGKIRSVWTGCGTRYFKTDVLSVGGA